MDTVLVYTEGERFIFETNRVPAGGVVVEQRAQLTGTYKVWNDNILNAPVSMMIGERGVVLNLVHGSRSGHLYVETFTGQHQKVSPQQLRDVLKRAGMCDKNLIINPCYPAAVRERWQHEIDKGGMHVIGDWHSRTIHEVKSGQLNVYEAAY